MELAQSKSFTACTSHFIHVNGIPTKVIKVDGQSTGIGNGGVRGCMERYTSNVIFLIIPGNPGIPDFYELFMETIFKASNCQVPVWAIGHAGHVEPPKDLTINNKERMLEAYSLDDQIQHKAAFISEHIPADKKLILIGHSIGCYIILELMKAIPTLPVLKALQLFPAIERMWGTPNGSVMAPLTIYCRWIAFTATYLANYLSDYVKSRLVNWYFRNSKVPKCAIQGALNVFNPYVMNSAVYMASTEMKEVLDLDVENVKNHLSKLLFYYGTSDGWCPLDFYHNAKALFPEGDLRLCKHGMEHAFVLESSELMGDLVWNWMKEEIAVNNNKLDVLN
ncbi:lipid droplet-associated hydrolase-like isoform X2 [Amphiura filiformis]